MKFTGIRTSRAGSGCKRIQVADIAKRAAKRTHPDSEDSWISGLEFRQTVAGLTPREKRIMELRYLKGETQMEVAREIGISQAQVSRLEKAALEQFRHK